MKSAVISGFLQASTCVLVTAGSIVVAVTDNVNMTIPPAAGSLANYSGSACVGVPAPASNCVGGVPPSTLQPSNSVSTASGSAQSSAGGPTNLSQALTLTANGQINTSGAENSAYGFSVIPSAPVSNYYLFPDIAMLVSPDNGATAGVQITAYQATDAEGMSATGVPFSFYNQLALHSYLSGTSPGSFVLDPTLNAMGLNVNAGDSGGVILSEFQTNQTTDPIDFEFQNGIVTVSTNSLGLMLPTVGSSADFLLTSLAPFQASLPSIPPSGSTVTSFLTFNAVFQNATLTPVPIPEPNTFFLTFGALGVGLIGSSMMRRSISSLTPATQRIVNCGRQLNT